MFFYTSKVTCLTKTMPNSPSRPCNSTAHPSPKLPKLFKSLALLYMAKAELIASPTMSASCWFLNGLNL